MTKFILHGGFTKKENHSNQAFIKELVKDVEAKGTILLVFFASREEDPRPSFEILKNRIRSEADEKDLVFVYATKENFIEEIKQAQAIYISGGSTNKLLEILRTYENLGPHLVGKTVAGSSAGAYAIATLGASHSEDVMREGLGLTPLRVVCHYESPELPPAEGAVQMLKQNAPELELVLLRDCEWKVFNF